MAKTRGSKTKPVAREASMESIAGYLEGVPARTRAALQSLRKAIKAAAPKADEVISYRVPSFKYHGMLVGFAAFREHCSFFLMSTTVMEAHKHELKRYDTSGGTIRFTADAPLPPALVKKLVKARIKENMARAPK